MKAATTDPAGLTARLHRVLAVHFDPDSGTPFWLDHARALGLDVCAEIRSVSDLARLGEMEAGELAERPLLDFIPRRFHDRLAQFVIGQTGGTTGNPVWTAYRHDEFVEAFVAPFVAAAHHTSFPRRGNWLYVGPSGPHIIGKVVRQLAEALDAHDPFSVDFDPRWARRLPDASFAQKRYLDHVVEQAVRVIETQNITVLFSTPPVVRQLGEVLTAEQRERIRGVHYGGMELNIADFEFLRREAFPEAVHLAGYGNTLFGCCLELEVGPRTELCYYPHGSRLHFELVDAGGTPVEAGQPGQVRFSRLDESFLIVGLRERDHARAVAAPNGASDGFEAPGLAGPHSPSTPQQPIAAGLY